jgi:Protein of unknown function (DUF2955)
MTLQTVQTLRLAFGVWGAIAAAYGVAWQLSFMAPLFATIFLVFPSWIGWKMARQLLLRMGFSLLLGLIISEFFLDFPLICILLYGLLFFFIYYNDTPLAPPFAAMFMTIGITIVPMMGLSGAGLPQFIAMAIWANLGLGLFFAWIFQTLMPNSLARQNLQVQAVGKPAPPSLPIREERLRQALTSTIVALTAIIIFFSFNLVAYAFAMIQICFMVGTPSAKASVQALKDNAIACCIGGLAMIIVFNLLVAVPTYPLLLALTLLCTLFFSGQMFGGGAMSKAYVSGLTTFLVLLGTSTMVDKVAATNFYLRIGQILFAGLFTVGGLLLVGHLLRPGRRKFLSLFLQRLR